MEETMDAFPFVLAESLGKTLAELDAMSTREYFAWAAFHVYRNAQQELSGKAGS